VIAVVAIVVVGPKDLPRLMRTFGHYAGKLRRAAADFQRQFEEAMRDTEIEEVKKAIESVRDDTPAVDLKAPIDKPIMLPNPSAQSTPVSTNGKGIAASPNPTEPGFEKPTPKRKRVVKSKSATSEAAAAKPAAAKPRRRARPMTAGLKPAKADPKP
jgi:sec-independent protein translocase protein TatB